MDRITLGERELCRIGLGTNRLTDTPENRQFLEAAVAAGTNHIDTAHLYTGGESEATIGRALAPFPESLTVATKAGYRGGGGPEGIRREVEESFERLNADTIALYYLHRADPDHALGDLLQPLAELHDEGRIEHVGISEVSVEQIEQAREVLPISAVQNEYNLGERKHDEVVEYCEENDIVFVPFYPLKGDMPELARVAERLGATPNQVKLAWLLRRSPAMAPIPGTLSIEHARENLAALELELSDEDFGLLSGSQAG